MKSWCHHYSSTVFPLFSPLLISPQSRRAKKISPHPLLSPHLIGPCQSLLTRLESAALDEEDESDPFDTQISEEEVSQEDIADLLIDDSNEEILDI